VWHGQQTVPPRPLPRVISRGRGRG
jgi:hypothetical protein